MVQVQLFPITRATQFNFKIMTSRLKLYYSSYVSFELIDQVKVSDENRNLKLSYISSFSKSQVYLLSFLPVHHLRKVNSFTFYKYSTLYFTFLELCIYFLMMQNFVGLLRTSTLFPAVFAKLFFSLKSSIQFFIPKWCVYRAQTFQVKLTY